MQTIATKSGTAPPPPKAVVAKPPGIAGESVPDSLATLHVNPDTGLTSADVDPHCSVRVFPG
jgi:hypothetical protein